MVIYYSVAKKASIHLLDAAFLYRYSDLLLRFKVSNHCSKITVKGQVIRQLRMKGCCQYVILTDGHNLFINASSTFTYPHVFSTHGALINTIGISLPDTSGILQNP